MPGDHHPLAFEGAVDQLRQLILGLCNAMGAHKSNIAIGWPFCPARKVRACCFDFEQGRRSGRNALRWTTEQLAKRAGVTARTIKRPSTRRQRRMGSRVRLFSPALRGRSIEQAGIERQIGPHRPAGVKDQWHYGESGALC